MRGAQWGRGYRDVNTAVDWIVVSCHWLSLVQLPGGSIIPPEEVGVGFGQTWDPAPFPQLTHYSLLLHPLPPTHRISRCPHHPCSPSEPETTLHRPQIPPPPLQDLSAIAVGEEESFCLQRSVKAADDLLTPAVTIPNAMARL